MPGLRPDRKRDDHACDVNLIERYQGRYAAAFTEALAEVNPADIKRVTEPPDGTPPSVAMMCVGILSWLREQAADGPFLTNLGARPVMIELDGPNVIEHPLAPGSDDRTCH